MSCPVTLLLCHYAAMALELQYNLQQQVVLILLDGPPVPVGITLPDPLLYGLYSFARDNGTLPALDPDGLVAEPFAVFTASISQILQSAMATASMQLELQPLPQQPAWSPAATLAAARDTTQLLQVLAAVPPGQLDILERCVEQLALSQFCVSLSAAAQGTSSSSAAGTAEQEQLLRRAGPSEPPLVHHGSDAVRTMIDWCRKVRTLVAAYAPDFVYQGPSVMVLTEDEEGEAFLEACRESCGGELSLVPLAGLVHGQVLTGAQEQEMVVVSVVDGLLEMLDQM
jgi:hypothetical protein